MIIKQSFLFLASITFLSLFSSSCRSAKYLQDDQYLVTDVDVKGIPTELKETAEMYVANDLRPNSPLYLTIYNLFNTRKGRYKTDNIKNVGESPRLLDSAIVELSAVQIQRFLQTKGYFNAQVEPVVALEKKKARIEFLAQIDEPYRIRQISREVEDPAVDSIYKQVRANQEILQEGAQYESSDLFAEREALYQQMREQGYFDYVRQYMRVGLDTLGLHRQTDLHIQVSNPDSVHRHQVYHIDSVYFTIEAAEG
ncbi:MAG: BamA/TamA family outer membrane protein, partial [Sphingobacterium sp.]